MGSLSADTSSLPEGKRSAGQDLVRDLGGDGQLWRNRLHKICRIILVEVT